MAVTRVNGVVRAHKKADKSRKTMRRKENKRNNRRGQNKLTLTSKYLADQLRKVRDFESRQNRRWVIAKQKAGVVSESTAFVLHRWINAKLLGQARPASKIKICSDVERQKHIGAWLAWTKLQKEREEAMRQWGDGVTVGDWWSEGSSTGKGTKEHNEVEGAKEAEGEEDNFGDEIDAMSVVFEDDEDYDEGGFQLEPPEPVSPVEYAG